MAQKTHLPNTTKSSNQNSLLAGSQIINSESQSTTYDHTIKKSMIPLRAPNKVCKPFSQQCSLKLSRVTQAPVTVKRSLKLSTTEQVIVRPGCSCPDYERQLQNTNSLASQKVIQAPSLKDSTAFATKTFLVDTRSNDQRKFKSKQSLSDSKACATDLFTSTLSHLEGSLTSLSKSTNSTSATPRISISTIDPQQIADVELYELASTYLVRFSWKAGSISSKSRGYFLCPICSEPFDQPSIISCGHMFCMSCVCGWFVNQDNCPCCRYRIVAKEDESDIFAKEFAEVQHVLQSIFTAGNFYDLVDRRVLSLSVESIPGQPLISCKTSEQILSMHLAPIFKLLLGNFHQESVGKKLKNSKHACSQRSYQIIKNNLQSAIWFLRHGLLCQASTLSQSQFDYDLSIIRKLPTLTRMEAFRGSELSRESLVRRIMSVKPFLSCQNLCFNVPPVATTNSCKKLVIQSKLRFRLPSTQGLSRMFITSVMFVMIALSIQAFEEPGVTDTIRLNKMDIMILLMTTIYMLINSEDRTVGPRRHIQRHQRFQERRRGQMIF